MEWIGFDDSVRNGSLRHGVPSKYVFTNGIL